MKRTRSLALLIMWCVLATVIRAHHAGSEYDWTTIEIEGELLEVAWQPPHVHFTVRTTDPSGKTLTWDIDPRRTSLAAWCFWDVELPRALATSRVVAVLVSPNYAAAHYLRDEVADAINRARPDGKPRIVPVYLDGLPSRGTSAPYGLGVIHPIDARAVGGLSGVASQIGALLPGSA